MLPLKISTLAAILSSRIFHAFYKNIACGAIYRFDNQGSE